MLAVDIHIDASGSVYKKALFIVARFHWKGSFLPSGRLGFRDFHGRRRQSFVTCCKVVRRLIAFGRSEGTGGSYAGRDILQRLNRCG